MSRAHARLLIVAVLGMAMPVLPASAEPVENFYRGKVITLIVGSDVSGEYATSARLLARHLGKHIPGSPTIIIQNMPGASSINATNYLYEIAAKDGTVIGLPSKDVALYQASRMPNTRYRVQDFNWIGNMSGANNLLVVWSGTGVKSIADARNREVIMGALARNGTLATYPLILNAIAGTKFKLVLGYAGSQIIDIAMERGEVEGKGSYSWANLKRTHPDWVRDRKLNILVQFGLQKEPELPDVPLITDLARNDQERQVLNLISSDTVMARPFLLPPNVPADRVAAMRAAFDTTITDPNFLADARASRVDIQPMAGPDLQALINHIIDTPREIIDLAQQWMTQE
jgi:tripartite-type tricarboxylate transporter receptor subunit TctC